LPELEAAVGERDDAALVTVVFSGDPRHVQAVQAATGLRAPVLFDLPVRLPKRAPRSQPAQPAQPDDDQPLTLKARYQVEQVPWTLVVNREGRAVEVLVGAHERERFIKALDAID
jgi:hypothetical protein